MDHLGGKRPGRSSPTRGSEHPVETFRHWGPLQSQGNAWKTLLDPTGVHPKCWIPLLLPCAGKHGIMLRDVSIPPPSPSQGTGFPAGYSCQGATMGNSGFASAGQNLWSLNSRDQGQAECPHMEQWEREREGAAVEGGRVLGKQKRGWFGRAGAKPPSAKGKASPGKTGAHP